ncbi:D-2-hydroxyacid dehydrogenase [Metallumcola ferriviriculae]|uniref:D-2-hydroxyacid dehydrogenase n=1 Tax=Metallumcola ferriviriculae TaxID=3039180 RepID=A0AAU0UN93_9FIRM|nr:D-2-hydroxyacid dehydrogenase [Desulfitibacteraceae bacterium MK1]
MTKVTIDTALEQHHLQKLIKQFPQAEFCLCEELAEEKELLLETEVLVTYGWKLTAELVRRMPKLKWIQALRAGVDNFPDGEITKQGIVVTTVRGIHGIPMAEHAFGMMLSFSRELLAFRGAQSQKQWRRDMSPNEIYGMTLGVVGTGSIGREVARRGTAFGMMVLGVNTSGNPVDGIEKMFSAKKLEVLLKQCDYVVVTLPLTDATYHMFGEQEFSQMKSTAYFINLARGQVVEEPAMVKALQEKEIAGAGLDVFEEEPLSPNSPLWEMENVLITPHLAALSPRYTTRAVDVFATNLAAYLAAESLHNVMNWKRGY